jgi:hypothetical protein
MHVMLLLLVAAAAWRLGGAGVLQTDVQGSFPSLCCLLHYSRRLLSRIGLPPLTSPCSCYVGDPSNLAQGEGLAVLAVQRPRYVGEVDATAMMLAALPPRPRPTKPRHKRPDPNIAINAHPLLTCEATHANLV